MNSDQPPQASVSTLVTLVVTWIGLGGAVALIPAIVPILHQFGTPSGPLSDAVVVRAAVCLYCCLAIGVAALIILLLLLTSIRRGEVFTAANVARLRLISYCGFAIMVVCVIGAIITQPRPVFLFVALVAGFLGLVMRVVKNVIDAARLLKEDADYTI
ncbi:MAG: DUF2975 domain-containing protein [Propionibacteriaceae bacterium]|jgi:hypothetical protein|nr:DUF2975 domain-containing protein [Propionibacteriaceae bacterium]